MSAEEGSTQPPTAGGDKAQAPKAAATFSSFINSELLGLQYRPG
jgi:transcription factor TFIIIB component B''